MRTLAPGCRYWLNGTDCAIVVPPAALPRQHKGFDVCSPSTGAAGGHGRHVWDGSFINTNLEAPKHMECYLNPSKTPFTLDAHRVNVSIVQAASGDSSLRDVSIAIMMRRVGSHLDAQSPADLAEVQKCETSPLNPYEAMKYPRPGTAACLFPRQTDIACTAFNCKPSYVPSQTEDKRWDAHYDCASAQCTPWAGLEASAKALLTQISSQKGGIQFDFKSVNETFGTARTLFVTKATTFDMQCSTGQCVPTNQSAPSHPKHFPKKPISPWTVAALCVLGVVALLSAWVVVQIRRQQRPGAEAKCVGSSMPQLQGSDTSASGSSTPGGVGARLGVAVAFSDVGYNVLQEGADADAVSPTPGTRRVLQGASGLVKPGEMCALMGPSGAGKSSLLDILAGQNKSGSVDGRVHLVWTDGGTVENAQQRRQVCRYVMQDDRVLATETVEEALMFSACMALPNSVPLEDVLAAVDEVIELLALSKVRQTRVGSSDAGGLSGGERRRLAVGIELIKRPAVLLADEPTSGLDSVSADIVMKTLSTAAKDGCSVIVTIHQPSAQIFSLFDTVCLLSAGGGQAFFGPAAGALDIARKRLHEGEASSQDQTIAGASDASVEIAQLERPLPQNVLHLNPAEELLEYVIDVGQEGVQVFNSSPYKVTLGASISQILDAAQQRSQSVAWLPAHERLIQANGEAALLPATSSGGDGRSIYHGASDDIECDRPGGYAQFEMLCRRGLRQVVRDPSLMFLQLVVTVFVGTLTGGLFYKPGLDLNGVHNRTGLLFFIVIYFSLISMSSIGAIVNDKETFLRERAAGLYTTEPFFASKVLCDVLPLRVLPPVLFGLILYPMCALHEGRIGIFIGAILLLNTTASAM